PLVYPDTGTNLAFDAEKGNTEKAREIIAKAAHVTEVTLVNNRLVCNYMEVRSCLADWSDDENRFTLTVGSQGAHGMRDRIAACMDIDKEALRVVTHDVGGGFGTKVFPYREYPLALLAAKRVGRPVRWLCDRSEHFVADAHGRDNVTTMRMGMDENGKFLALDVDLIAAMGGYLHTYGPYIPSLGATIATGVYDIPACGFRFRGVYTHTTPTDAYRGAGRPEAIYALERLVDQCARDMGLAPEVIRRRNFITPDQMPYETSLGRTYDTGDFEQHFAAALETAQWDTFDGRAAEAAGHGKLRGIGLSTYIEACAFAGSEPAKLSLNADGTVAIHIGTQSNGQGHKTAYAQFAAEALNMNIDEVDVMQGDTDDLATGGGTGGSRSIPLGGVSVKRGSEALAERIREVAAEKFEAAAGDLELEDGQVRIVGTDRAMSFADVAAASSETLTGTGNFKQAEATYPNGTHVCEVEIEPETGSIEVVGYTIVDDYGTVVNPLLLEGQVHGGVAQAIGQAIHEHTVYDDDGQLITASFMDYRMPRALDIPNFTFDTRNVPSTTNALGIKGAGEAGTIGGCPAVMNAIVDALHRAYGIEHIDMPVTPLALWEAIDRAAKAKAA
ncbi:MAG: molybdopterin cofactor-binding domain-containing protein, partial [Pseudomonadota bacterium]